MSTSFDLNRPPRFASVDGQVGEDPLALLERPRIAPEQLALFLSDQAVGGEWAPGAPWVGLTRIRDLPVPDPVPSTRAELGAAFELAVSELTDGHETVGVSLSGGLDSLVVLYRACLAAGRRGQRVVAIHSELTDDRGQSSTGAVRQLLAQLPFDVELRIAPRIRTEPRWSATGPRLEALPGLVDEANDAASAEGATILLTGDGADELLRSCPGSLNTIADAAGYRVAGRYLTDLFLDEGVVAVRRELLAFDPWRAAPSRDVWACRRGPCRSQPSRSRSSLAMRRRDGLEGAP